jgi:hypothetical protein
MSRTKPKDLCYITNEATQLIDYRSVFGIEV